MATKKSGKLSEDKIVREVIKKYGDQISLKETPHVLIEILRAYGRVLDENGDGGSAPGGAPPSGPESRREREEEIDNEMLMKEILKLGRQVKSLQSKLGK